MACLHNTPAKDEKIGHIDTDFGVLYIYNENVFSIKKNDTMEYFTIIGDDNFNAIFTDIALSE